jgi:hypothetical protein
MDKEKLQYQMDLPLKFIFLIRHFFNTICFKNLEK